MSIIHDALKKVQQTMTTAQIKPGDIVAVLPSFSRAPDKKPISRRLSRILVSIGLLLIVATDVFIFSQIKKQYPQPSRLYPPAPVAQTPVAKTSVPPVTRPLTQTTIGPAATKKTVPLALNVQGVMASGGHNVALINNNIYEEGSFINDARILKINLNAITIERDGEQKTVMVTR